MSVSVETITQKLLDGFHEIWRIDVSILNQVLRWADLESRVASNHQKPLKKGVFQTFKYEKGDKTSQNLFQA